MRPLASHELLLPSEDALEQSDDHLSTPFVQLCGNHEDMCVIDLLQTTKVKSQIDNVIFPYIIEINGEILVLYGINYHKLTNKKLKTGEWKLVSPQKFFDTFPL